MLRILKTPSPLVALPSHNKVARRLPGQRITAATTARKAAEAKKISQEVDFAKRLAFARNRVLMEMMLQSEAKSAVKSARKVAASARKSVKRVAKKLKRR